MPGPTLFRPSNITTGLVGYWKLDEASGSRADSSGNGNTLTDNNTVASVAQDYWKTGENSADFEFANNESLSRTNASQTGLGLTTTYSIAGWVKRESAGTTQTIVQKWASSAGYIFRLNSSGMQVLHDATTYSDTGAALAVGKWHHMAVIYDDTNNLISFYLDGNLNSVLAATINPASNSGDFSMGIDPPTSSAFDGLMKDVAIWNVALTPIQIKSLALGVDLSNFAYRPTNVSTQPTHYWKLNEAVVSGTRYGTVGGVDLTDATTTATKGGYIEGAAPDFATDYLSAPDSANWDVGTGDFAISYWAYHDTSVNGRYMFSHGASPSLGIRYTGGQWLIYIAGATPIAYTYTQPTSTWEHYVIRRSGTTLTLWIDGVQVASATNSTNVTGGATVFSIGAFNDGSNGHDGRICDFAFWKGYAPTDAEIKSLACGIPLQQTGIVSYWKLDETSGSRADSIVSNTLTDNNTVLSGTGKVGNAADFELSNTEYLSISDASQSGLDITTDGALLCWINAESTAANATLMSKWNASTGYALRMTSANVFRLEVDGTGLETTATLADATWGHIVGQWNGATREIYINSVLVSSGALTTFPSDTAHAFNLGAYNSASEHYDGLMDEPLAGKRYLRPEEIKTIYCKGLAGKELTNSEIALDSSSFFMLF